MWLLFTCGLSNTCTAEDWTNHCPPSNNQHLWFLILSWQRQDKRLPKLELITSHSSHTAPSCLFKDLWFAGADAWAVCWPALFSLSLLKCCHGYIKPSGLPSWEGVGGAHSGSLLFTGKQKPSVQRIKLWSLFFFFWPKRVNVSLRRQGTSLTASKTIRPC